jgi:hypothetical protein
MFCKVIEINEPARDLAEAQEMVEGLKLQDGAWGARVIGDGNRKPYAAQAFMDLPEDVEQQHLPDGMKICIAPPALMAMRP